MIIVVLSLPVFSAHSSSISFSDSVSLISSRLVFGAVVGRPMFGLVVFFIYTVVIASSNILLAFLYFPAVVRQGGRRQVPPSFLELWAMG